MKKRITILQATVLIIFSFLQHVHAEDAIYTGYFSNKAVSGYDVVSYFTEQKSVKGSSQYQFEYQGADWYFSSQEHLTLFKNNPEKYAPQYGGYCAWAMAEDQIAPGKAPYWTVYKNKLYLNYDQEVLDTWIADKDNFIKQADLNWAKIDKEL
ncbi:YHS domain-containing protein [Psychromonas sp. RZ22]|uniref:YHS domain-containing (seleno)protein n=1 Tax=Psychromonas algarum TaxID=2555643 RepID=UPI001067A5EE|nr:YHS domain-containing (seleno)protein [Psychromonas sp. RZ22]TEW53985.1 YHS domain-containing protein [Psychromonas sp. RZ22]